MCGLELPRGMRDFGAGYSAYIEHVRERFMRVSDLYGFSFMDPSPLELLSTLETKSGPAIRDEIYHFRDKGDREVGLRFDLTMGLTRHAAAQKSMRLPAKVSAFGGVFRYDEPQKGRYRHFHQWDVEVYGRPGPGTDCEIIEMTAALFDSLGLADAAIHASHRGLVEAHIGEVFGGAGTGVVSDMLRAMDKTAKKPAEAIVAEFEAKGYDPGKVREVLAFAGVGGTPDEVERAVDTSRLEHWDYLRSVVDSAADRGVPNVKVDFGIVRGLDYYSGMVFEVFGDPSIGALAGGGRYDSLARAFGRDDIGAAGVAGGVERIILAMEGRGIAPPAPAWRVAVAYVNKEMFGTASSVAAALRRSGIPADIDLAGRSLKRQMEAAAGARFAIIVGPKEAAAGGAVVRDMEGGGERTVPLADLTGDPASVLS